MIKVGIIFAMEEELDAFKSRIEVKNENTLFGVTFINAVYDDIDIIMALSGVGKVNAARTAQLLIDNYNVDCVFNVGVAGGLSNSLNVEDVVIGDKLVQHDFDITAFDHEFGYVPNVGVYALCDRKLNKIAVDVLAKNNVNVISGVIASGDIFLTDSNRGEFINKEFNALCVEMEGAAIGQVCYLCNIPFLVMRSISDVPGKDNKVVYEEFLEDSSNVIGNCMIKILDCLK